MASIALTRTWVTLATDLTTSVQVDASDRSRTQSIQGEIRVYGGGRLRFAGQAGQQATVPLTFRTNDRTLIDTLTGWIGETVLIRDPRGRAEWCVFTSIAEQDLTSGWTEVQISFERVTYSIAV